jgi:hypothetical protein
LWTMRLRWFDNIRRVAQIRGVNLMDKYKFLEDDESIGGNLLLKFNLFLSISYLHANLLTLACSYLLTCTYSYPLLTKHQKPNTKTYTQAWRLRFQK